MYKHQVVFIIAILMMMGSLYVGTFGNPIENIISGDLFNSANAIIPCTMCRYIRMSSYPLALISGLQLRHRHTNHFYLLKAFARFTLVFCSYKYYLEMTGVNSTVCTVDIPCSDPGLIYGGFITLALMGIVCSVTILIILFWPSPKPIQHHS